MLKQLFDKLSPSKPRPKKLRMDDDTEDEMMDTVLKSSFNEADKQFLQELVGGIGNHINEKVAPIREEQTKLATQVADLTKENREMRQRLAALESGTTQVNIDEIKKQVIMELPQSTLSPPPGLRGDEASQSGASSSQNTTDDRDSLYILGSLGVHAERPVIMERAKQVLNSAGITTEQLADLWAPQLFGSFAFFRLAEGVNVRISLGKIRKVNMSFVRSQDGTRDSHVWVDRAKSRTERFPTMLHRAIFTRCQTMLHAEGINPSKFLKCGATKSIYYESHDRRVGKVNRQAQWVWESFATTTFTEELLGKLLREAEESLL